MRPTSISHRVCSRVAWLAAAACLAAASGCGGTSHPSEAARADAVVNRWLAAERAGDGRTWCAQLSAARLTKEAVNIFNATGKHYSCATMHSGRPPGVAQPELYVRARRELTEGFRLERTAIFGRKATVTYSWLVSTESNPLINYQSYTREGNRFVATVSLVREGGNWKIGQS